MNTSFEQIREDITKAKLEIAKVVIGQNEIVENTLIALLSNGHVLLEGAPGLAKTLLVRAIGKVFGLEFKRAQFTPDMMPNDLSGSSIYQPKDGTFKFTKGPIFTNLLLADEINRAPPKTQSSLLEAMQERQLTSESKRYELPNPFLVLATQNPIDQEGTYPLPEAQVDRFMFKLLVDYPTEDEELEILKKFTAGATSFDSLEQLKTVISKERIIELQKQVRHDITISEELMRYIVKITSTTRESEEVSIGASPRASIWLTVGAKAQALINGRDYVNPLDIQKITKSVLRHRILVSPEWTFEGIDSDSIITRVLKNLPVPSV